MENNQRINTINFDKCSIMGFLNLIGIVLCIFIPTSKNAEIFQLNRLIFVWIILLLIIIVMSIINVVNIKQLLFSLILINIYMVIVTLLAKDIYSQSRFSLARVAPVLVLIYLMSIKFVCFPRLQFMKVLLNIVSIISIIWNTLLFIGYTPIIDFTYNNFNQYYPLCGLYQIILGHKPVMSFGVYTYASYFYFFLFVCSFSTYKIQKKFIYILYSISYCVFCLLLGSVSSFVFFVIMLVILFGQLIKKLNRNTLFVILIAVFIVLGFVIYNSQSVYDQVMHNLLSEKNGFLGRYTSTAVLSKNFEIIRSSLGIGYNIVDNLEISYSDSGYVLYLTMGNLPFLISIYSLLFRFLKDNLVLDKKFIMFVIFGFELALPATFNYRFSYMIIFLICYLGSLYTSQSEINQECINSK